jgi:hypothetical protein
VTIERVPGSGPNIAHCIGVHLLSGAENGGNHNVFLGVIDASGNRVPNAKIGWTWEGRTETQMLAPVPLDKPPDEPPGNIPLNARPNLQIATVWVFGGQSDLVKGLTPAPDVPEEPGSTWGHRSYLVCFQVGVVLPVTPPVQPPVEPPVVPGVPFDVGPAFEHFVSAAGLYEDAITQGELMRNALRSAGEEFTTALKMLADLRAAHQG